MGRWDNPLCVWMSAPGVLLLLDRCPATQIAVQRVWGRNHQVLVLYDGCRLVCIFNDIQRRHSLCTHLPVQAHAPIVVVVTSPWSEFGFDNLTTASEAISIATAVLPTTTSEEGPAVLPCKKRIISAFRWEKTVQ